MPSRSEAPSGGAKAFCLLLRFSKVSRRQGGTLSAVTAEMDMYPVNKIPVGFQAAIASKLAPTVNRTQ
jgi:hypothetical protein